jgi:hypothetical protein
VTGGREVRRNSVAPLAGKSLPIFETRPEKLTLHMVEDHQLEALTNMSRPIALALAGASTGGFLGLIPSAMTAFHRVGTTDLTGADMAGALICVGCIVCAVIAWPLAIKGQIAANNAVKSIRDRSQHPI